MTRDEHRGSLALRTVIRKHGSVQIRLACVRYLEAGAAVALLFQLRLDVSHFLHQAVELIVNAIGAALDKVLLALLRVAVPLEKAQSHLQVSLLLFEHLQSELEAL